jgi:hypothetical protein
MSAWTADHAPISSAAGGCGASCGAASPTDSPRSSHRDVAADLRLQGRGVLSDMTACSAGADLTSSSWSLGSRSDVVAAPKSVPNRRAVSTLVPAGVSFRFSLFLFPSARDRLPSSTMARGRSRGGRPAHELSMEVSAATISSSWPIRTWGTHLAAGPRRALAKSAARATVTDWCPQVCCAALRPSHLACAAADNCFARSSAPRSRRNITCIERKRQCSKKCAACSGDSADESKCPHQSMTVGKF